MLHLARRLHLNFPNAIARKFSFKSNVIAEWNKSETMPLINAELERNLRLFPSYKAATSVLPWLPIFFLYFLERVSLGDVVMLGSTYYFAVFVLEVPSGYCSDRYGRRPILIFASIVTVVACALFAAANSFAVLFIASILLATRTAFQSGSDSALLYDSLYALGREKEYTEFETNAQKWSMTTLGCSCLLGGGLGMVDMRLTYLVGFLAALVAVVLCVKFVEPPMETGERTSGFVTQMKQIVSYFTQPFLAWVLVFYIVGYSLEHIPYEFYQPYIKLLSETDASQWLPNQSAPIISSVVISISMFGGAFGAAVSQRILGRVGVRVLLL